MSGPSTPNLQPVTGRDDLVAWLESGCKPAEDWRLGTEHEKFCYRLSDKAPLPYADPEGGPSIRDMLKGLEAYGWTPVAEGENVIAMTRPDGSSISLEPGGQLELSGAPLRTVHETCTEVTTHRRQVRQVAESLGVGLIGLGFAPTWTRAQMHWMPKGRYAIMKAHMPRVGHLGLDMMLRTCTVQVNMDFASEADMVKKFRVASALQPVATALWANSPFTEGRPNGYRSYRAYIWTDTDNQRSGFPEFAFEDGFGFERYVDYLLDVPMYFVMRDGKFVNLAGRSFRDFLEGKLPELPGETPTLGDWADHASTAFPDVRLKKYIEMRGADGGPWSRLCALPGVLGRTSVRHAITGCGLGSGEGLDGGGARCPARRRAQDRAANPLPRWNGTGPGAGSPAHLSRRFEPPFCSLRRWRRRERLPGTAPAYRRKRQDARRRASGSLREAVERQSQSALGRLRVLIRHDTARDPP